MIMLGGIHLEIAGSWWTGMVRTRIATCGHVNKNPKRLTNNAARLYEICRAFHHIVIGFRDLKLVVDMCYEIFLVLLLGDATSSHLLHMNHPTAFISLCSTAAIPTAFPFKTGKTRDTSDCQWNHFLGTSW